MDIKALAVHQEFADIPEDNGPQAGAFVKIHSTHHRHFSFAAKTSQRPDGSSISWRKSIGENEVNAAWSAVNMGAAPPAHFVSGLT